MREKRLQAHSGAIGVISRSAARVSSIAPSLPVC